MAYVSFTFDDGYPEHRQVADLFDRHGLRATFFPCVGKVIDDPVGWKSIAQRHEIGNHTLAHPMPRNQGMEGKPIEHFTIPEIEYDIITAQSVISTTLGVAPVSFAYPAYQTQVGQGGSAESYEPIVAKNFLCARAGMGPMMNNPSLCNMHRLYSWPLDGMAKESVMDYLASAIKGNMWLIFYSHRVVAGRGVQETSLETLEYALQSSKELHRDLSCLTMSTAASMILTGRNQ